jgi:methionyl-tRNA synthetase
MNKKLYINTAIPYVNGTPHIGHAMDYLLADIWTRYQKQHGYEVRFSVGTDEHGNKIAEKAAEAGLSPQEFADKMYINFEDLMKKLDTSYTDFTRTTDKRHMAAVQYIWQKLQPYIYKGKYEGWYCTGCRVVPCRVVSALLLAAVDRNSGFPGTPG